jgi:hypothetical protein
MVDEIETTAALEMLIRAAKARHRELQAQKLSTLVVGDRVRFTQNVRPKYLVGRTATVKRITDKHVYVDGAEVGSRFAGQPNCRVFKSTIEKV